MPEGRTSVRAERQAKRDRRDSQAFYKDYIYPHLVHALGNPKPIADIRERIIPLAYGDVEVYLREVLTRTPDHPINQIEKLLPWNIGT